MRELKLYPIFSDNCNASEKKSVSTYQYTPKQVDDIKNKRMLSLEESTTVGLTSKVIRHGKLGGLTRKQISLSETSSNNSPFRSRCNTVTGLEMSGKNPLKKKLLLKPRRRVQSLNKPGEDDNVTPGQQSIKAMLIAANKNNKKSGC